MKRRGFAARAAIAVALASMLAGCSSASGSSGTSGSSEPILIGASIPLTGGLAGFGYFEKWGYQHAVAQVNASGGISVDGVKRKVKLILLDDQTDPNATANNVLQLITQDHVSALLGSCTDSLVVPGALIAERNGVPMVTPCATTNGFASYRSWKWVWDIFFNSLDLTEAPFKMMSEDHLTTNKKIAILHSNGTAENVIGGKFWPDWAKQYGYDVTSNVAFPPTATDFTSDLQAAKAAGAQILLAIGEPPSMIAMRKQMLTIGFNPKLVVMEEGGEPLAFANALGSQANGVLVGGYWDSTFPYPGAAQIRTEFQEQTHSTYSQHIADTDAAATVLLNAIARAGSLDPAKINTAISQTSLMTVVGQVKFTAQHTYTLPMVEMQWQNGHCYVVAPADRANAKLIFPMPAS
ncbi:MAG: amino acid ABC transporter substrate-binding protein [Streptosporangiaceae bacterium]